MRRAAFIGALCIALSPAASWAQVTGDDAFALRDFALAQRLWEREAAAGSPEAMLGLGLLADRGYTGTRDFDVAYQWYEQAANLGLAEAQFNIAIMHDAGLGRPRDPQAALMWYTRAALRGHARAQYNVGLLFEVEDEIAANAALAEHWFDLAASSVPAAADRPVPTDDQAVELASPDLQFLAYGDDALELVWHGAASQNQGYLVEVLRVPRENASYAPPIISQGTMSSGLLAEAQIAATSVIARVSNVTASGDDYAPSAWIGPEGVEPPEGRVTLVVDPARPTMVTATTMFAEDLRASGFWVRIEVDPALPTPLPLIQYGYSADRGFAEVVGQYLPRQTAIAQSGQATGGTEPGEIIVNLAALR